MPDKTRLRTQIENAADAITPLWPLKSFVAANPLAGFEDRPFHLAIETGQKLFGGNGYPSRQMGQAAVKAGAIHPDILKNTLNDANATERFDDMVNGPVQSAAANTGSEESPLNRQMIKYLSVYLDEGQAAWTMPGREHGFYAAWKNLAKYDDQLGDLSVLSDLPDDAMSTIDQLSRKVEEGQREDFFRRCFAALPGWVGYIRWRMDQDHHSWQTAYPMTLVDYLAVRLAMAKMLDQSPAVEIYETQDDREGQFWLAAFEESYRQGLFNDLMDQSNSAGANNNKRPDAQMVFCIDVRSEVIRRHIEAQGNYETLGFAGFFGVPIRYQPFGSDHAVDSCPVLLKPKFEVTETCDHDHGQRYLARKNLLDGLMDSFGALKKNMATSFAFVEGAGAIFSIPMAAKSLIPNGLAKFLTGLKARFFAAPDTDLTMDKSAEDDHGLSHAEQIFYAEAGLSIMGLTSDFGRVVMFCGHGSQTVNNPYASGLDCGACGGNHGGPNARLLARICNKQSVRSTLSERGIDIPDDTIFIAGQHNTTTDEIEILTPKLLPEDQLQNLKQDLELARRGAVAERRHQLTTARHPNLRANDWAEVRPEWGLAGNAGFIAGPREWTKDLNLNGRCFLHSYDWRADADGKILETIMTAPLVVAQWINTQYYFSTVDNTIYGSGSKTTQNVTGTFGVMQGNASDLMTGLAMQSVMVDHANAYHHPLRLMAAIYAPLDRVKGIIDNHDILQTLFDHQWVGLSVMDPETGQFYRYHSDGNWRSLSGSSKDQTRYPSTRLKINHDL